MQNINQPMVKISKIPRFFQKIAKKREKTEKSGFLVKIDLKKVSKSVKKKHVFFSKNGSQNTQIPHHFRGPKTVFDVFDVFEDPKMSHFLDHFFSTFLTLLRFWQKSQN